MLKQHLSTKKYITISMGICLTMLILNPLFNIAQTSAQSVPDISANTNDSSTHSLSKRSHPSDTDLGTKEGTQSSDRSIDLNNNSFFNPPNKGAPDRTADGGSRGICPNYGENPPVTLLIPNDSSNNNSVSIAASTVSEYPTLLWYIPESSNLNSLALTLIDDHTGQIIYQDAIAVPNQAGIMSFKLPETQPPLQVGHWYHWVLSVSPSKDSEKALNSPCFAEAYIGRRPLNSNQQQELINSATNLQDLWNFYVQEIIWYDALATLDKLRRQNPDNENINRTWQAFLGLSGLANLSDYPPLEPIEFDDFPVGIIETQ